MSRQDRKIPIYQLMSTNGDGTGTVEAIGDYSVTPLRLKVSRAGGYGHIARMIVQIQDFGRFDASKYGNGLILTNGIRIYVRNAADELLWEYTSFPVKTNADWAAMCHDFSYFDFGDGSTDNIGSVRWTFQQAGQRCLLQFDQGEYLEVVLNDDFTGLVHHRFTVQGHDVTQEV